MTGVTYRNPAFLVKTVTTLDVISGGRAIFGLGAAWNEDEHIALRLHLPAGQGADGPARRRARDRQGHVHEASASAYEGKYARVDNIINSPRPVQPGGPKIMVGGGGEQRTLRIAAKYADMTHWFPSGGLATLNHKSDVLRGYCEEIGRDPAEIERTMGAPVVRRQRRGTRCLSGADPTRASPALTVGSPAQCAEALKPYIDAGFTGFTFGNTVYRHARRDPDRGRDAAPGHG